MLPSNIYTVVDKYYTPIEKGGGCSCDNCGRLITNIAVIKNEANEVFNIGLDCLETTLMKNNLVLGFDMPDLEKTKSYIRYSLKVAKDIKEFIAANPAIAVTGLIIETPSYLSDWFAFYYLLNGAKTSRQNSGTKVKNIGKDADAFAFIVKALKSIFKNFDFILK